MLSTGEQAKNQSALPVDRSALARMVENEIAAHERAMEEYEGKEHGEITVSFSFDYDIEAITAQLHTPFLSDHVIHRQAWLPVLHYARGEIGQEEAIAQITEAARIYLAEVRNERVDAVIMDTQRPAERPEAGTAAPGQKTEKGENPLPGHKGGGTVSAAKPDGCLPVLCVSLCGYRPAQLYRCNGQEPSGIFPIPLGAPE